MWLFKEKLKTLLAIFLVFIFANLFSQTTVFTDNYSTASNWSYLANSSATTPVSASSTTNPQINGGLMKITSPTGSSAQEARIYQQISNGINKGIIGHFEWYVDFEFTKLSSPSSTPNSMSLVMISEASRGLQYRTSSVGTNNINCFGVEIGGAGVIQIFQNEKGSTTPTLSTLSSSTTLSDNVKYYARLDRKTDTATLSVFTNSSKTGSPLISISLSVKCDFASKLDYVVHSQSAGWGSSSNGFSVELDSLSIVKINGSPATNIFSFNDTTLCSTDSLQLNPSINALTYLWSDSTTTKNIVIKKPGLYWLEITTPCVFRDSIIVYFDTLPDFVIGGDSILCNSKTAWLKPKPHFANTTYLWNSTTFADSILVSTKGRITLNAVKGKCKMDTAILIKTFLPKDTLQILGDTLICNLDSVSLSSNMQGDLLWSNGSVQNQTKVYQAGEYWLRIKENICEQHDTIQIKSYPINKPDLGNDTTLCSTDSLQLSPSINALTYLWSDGTTTKNIVIKKPGLYWLEITTPCVFRDSIFVYFDTLPDFVIGGDSILCNSKTAWLKPKPYFANTTYLWNSTTLADSILASTKGRITLNAVKGKCKMDTSILIKTFLPKDTLQILGDTLICNLDSVSLSSNMQGALLWSNGSVQNQTKVYQAGEYWLRIKENICEQHDTIQITTHAIPKPDLGNNIVVCDSLVYTLNPSFSFDTTLYQAIWNDNTFTYNRTFSQGGDYFLNIIEGKCKNSDTLQITFIKKPQVILMEDTLICSNDSIALFNFNYNPVDDLIWNNGKKTPIITVSFNGLYWLKSSNECGTASDTFELKTKNCLCKIHVPNAFTPNNDGLNDGFKPQFDGCFIKEYQFSVYNKWGGKLFESNNENEFWDGKGAQKGAYYWILKLASPFIDGGAVTYMQGLVYVN